jgi:predicted nucleic acid-binding protein
MSPPENSDKLFLDVNALAITLVEDHPGHSYLYDTLESGLLGEDQLLVHDYLPLRAQWVLTTKWGIERHVARNAVTSFLNQPVRIVSASRETLFDAYEISARKNHDVYDSFFIALCRQEAVDRLVSTDGDFESLCADESTDWHNPVPDETRKQFHRFNEE